MTNLRRLLPVLALIALLIAPFGRMGMAEATTAPHHDAPMAIAGHCEDSLTPAAPGQPNKTAIDCMIACAAVAPVDTQLLAEEMPAAPAPGALPLATFHGLHPGADPPPPRAS